MFTKLTVAACVGVLTMLLPATAMASGGGSGLAIIATVYPAPIALLLLIVQGVVFKFVESVVARKAVGWVALVLGVLIGCFQLYFIVDAFRWYGRVAWPFDSVREVVLILFVLALTVAVIFMGWRLRS